MSKNFYSATKLKFFINNRDLIIELKEKLLDLKPSEKTIIDNLRIKKGLDHEAEYFKQLSKKYKKVKNIKILKNLSIEEKINETNDALKNGYDLIYGGWLKSKNWIGELDFLEINNAVKSNLGNWSYEIIDTKYTSKVKGDHIYQGCLYSLLLFEIQGIHSNNFYIVLKDFNKVAVKLSEVYESFLFHKDSFENFIKNELHKKIIEKISHCSFQDLQEFCENERVKSKHLNQIYGTNKINIKKLNKAGIYNYVELAKLDPKKNIEKLKDDTKIKLINQAKLKIESEEKGYPIFDIKEENKTLNKGFNLLPEPSECDLFFDIEGVLDYVFDGKLEYLFGIYYEEGGEKIFKTFWAHNKEEERQSVIDFFSFTKAHFKKYPKAKIYHYAHYEITALERLTSLYKIHDIDYDHYLHLSRFVDLYKVVRNAIFISGKSYSIKEIEKYYPFRRTGEIQKGDVSEEYYIRYIETGKKSFLKEIEDYNKQDCESTFKLRKWLLKIKPEDTKFFVPEKENIELRPYEEILIEYRKKLNDSKIKNTNIGKILSDILGYYQRELKPSWREFYSRKDLSHEELVDDRECIGNMKLASIFQEKKSYVYLYKFSEQEHKLKEKKRAIIANNTDPDRSDFAGTIQELDQIKRTVILKKGISKEQKKLPKVLSIGEGLMQHKRFENLNNNIYKFCDNILDNKDGYNAIKSFLNKDIPRIKGLKHGDKIIKSENFDEEIPKIILNLQDSYIFLQGPPGSGKSFQSGNAIVEILKKNKRVAVTGNSHKVIHNVLEKVEKIAIKQNFSFKGLYMGNIDDDEKFFDGKLIKTERVKDPFINALRENKIHLFAGTKFHLAQSYYQKEIDYLLIDEASQLSVADLVSLGGVAKNIILVGDQQQLGQPTKGNHPNESGKSVLEYLLDGKDTISKERGIFLNTTYRLHPNINNYISENFYDGRLITNTKNQNRKIEYKKDSLIKSEGIHTILMNHSDRSQTSEEECEVIKKLMNQLIGCDYTDYDNSKRKLTIEDFLIVSPYNAQVNFLKARLEKGVQIGTIDKFQGSEKIISIISMTSSSIEDLSRNKKFFFNRNRLNVGISRAKCCSIILFNQKLLEPPPKTHDEFKLINNFQKLLKYKVKTDWMC